MATDTATLVLRLSGFVRREDDVWLSGCRALDVFSQGDTPAEARAHLEEAVELWIASCLERDTLGEAFRELGWSPIPWGSDESTLTSPLEAVADGEDRFPLEVEIPAFQASGPREASATASG